MKKYVKKLNDVSVAVIMCVYKNDTPEYLRLAIDSILHQEVVSPQLFIFVDGPISNPIKELLEFYSSNDRVVIKFNDDNVGLATGLNWLIDNLELDHFDYVARMDADDVSMSNRLVEQIIHIIKTGAAVVGADCYEINWKGEKVFHKKMESSDENLKSNIIKRCPFVHPSVLFDAKVFKVGYRYDSSLMNTQDYYLWVVLARDGFVFSNVNQPLLLFRMNETFYERRGLKKAMNEFHGRVFAMKQLHILNFKNIFFTVSYLLLRIMPVPVSKFAYKFLR
jgi:glycosyltransferase involved in cell wall biosynthesis